MKTVALALTFAVATTLPACATIVGPMPSAPSGLRIGAVSEPSSFEKHEAAGRNDTFDDPEQANAAKRRKGAFWAGVGLAAFGAAGSLAFGVGGRVVQGQLANGYDNEDLTRAEEDRLKSTGKTMNGLTIGTVSVGLFGVALLAVAYALDHTRCGDLPPKRADCPRHQTSMRPKAPPPPPPAPSAEPQPAE